jgi:hypothetical protein
MGRIRRPTTARPTKQPHLLREPENARRLLAAIDRLEHGAGAPHDLVDPSG